MNLQLLSQDGSVPADISLLQEEADAHADVLICRDRDNTVRWTPGERLHHLFEQRCDLFAERGDPNHLAIESDAGVLSYGDLDRRANRLARCLIKQGLCAGDVVGLLFDQSLHCYVSLLAVLKINAAYVPLDPGFPQDRITYIAGDAGLRTILTLSEHEDRIDRAAAAVICVDDLGAQIDAEAATRLGEDEVGRPTSNLCYVIYTSGTTGRPKGVPIEHASICNFVRVAAEVYGYREKDRVYQGLTIAFDFSVEEIWVPLIAGATLIPNQTGGSLLGSDLASFLSANGITAVCCVPTLLATMDRDLPDLRLLIVSGEACPQDLVKRWHSPGRTILNAYGPTEATVTATVAVLKPDEPVTIGEPLPTYSIVILSPDENRALPHGQVGELGIAGICLSKGYLNRPDLTKAAFIDDFLKLPNNPSRRIYRTGDLARVNDRNEVEYYGRIDAQVKIRGYRIELTEIESVLMQLPQVAQAVVNTHESEPGVTELVAYYTLLDDTQDLTPEDVAGELRTLLPSYMVPAFYERLPVIPMLLSDKVDRKSLPAPSGRRLQRTNGDYVPPEGELETNIAAVLADHLRVDQVSVSDHFFDDLGANSLLMARVSATMRRKLGITDFSMKEMYSYPSVRQLSKFLALTSKRREPLKRNKPNHIATNYDYYSCGALQLLFGVSYLYFYMLVFYEGIGWTLEADGWLSAYGRATVFATVSFAISVSVPIALKWVLIGRWKEEEFPVWSLRYLRFWIVKQLIRLNPMVAFVGSPLYLAYLKALGTRISWNSAIFSTTVPVCTDLVSIADGAVVRKNSILSAYRAESNRIRTGRITIGRNAFVGEGTVLDINSVMEDGSQLGHTSSLRFGQRLAAGGRYHGSPAEETDTSYDLLEHGRLSLRRKAAYSLGQLGALILVYMPTPLVIADYLFATETEGADAASAVVAPEASTISMAPELLWYTFLVYFGTLLGALALTLGLPRFLYLFITAERTYKLYGFRYYIYRSIASVSNSTLFNALFGDSFLIVHYLRALGYKFRGLIQTGSNFGVEHSHDIPFLCEIGKGTMVSDGLSMINADASNTVFKLSKVSIGPNNFFGNNVFYPPQGRTGENCLFATKAMIPIDGPVRANTGLLGSPSFPIPRSVRRDKQFTVYNDEDARQQHLRRKNVSNLITLGLYIITNWMFVNFLVLGGHFIFVELWLLDPLALTLFSMVSACGAFLYSTLLMWAVLGFKPLQPLYCSIYDPAFWAHERYWKFSLFSGGSLLNGTPFKSVALRLLGVRVGKKLFDDGCVITEMTLLTIGSYCTLNGASTMQSHSLEDGTFKSDHIVIGDGCTLGTNAFVHYGVEMESDVGLEPDSFLMKGERPPANSVWRGNPAREMQAENPQAAC